MESLIADLRYGLRQMIRRPGFTATAITVLALGLGVTLAVFGLVDALLFASPSFPRPAEVVQVFSRNREQPGAFRGFSHDLYRQVRAHGGVFSEVMAHHTAIVALGDGQDRRVQAQMVSASFFSVLQVSPARGRSFLPAEDTPDSDARVALVSHSFWKKRGFDAGLLGSVVRINARPFTVVGIMPPGFTGSYQLFAPEVWLPLGSFDAIVKRHLADPQEQALLVAGRLRAGTSETAAGGALAALARQLEPQFPVELRDRTFTVGKPARFGASPRPDPPGVLESLSALLLGLAVLVLLVACLNLTSMLQARSTERRKEIAVRQALGAGRGRIVRQLLVEGLLLAVAGGAAGMLLAMWCSDLAASALSARLPVDLVFDPTPGPGLLAAGFAVCALATIVVGLGPALSHSGGGLRARLGQEGKSFGLPPENGRRWTRHPLLVVQIAVSLALLTAGALFVRSAREAATMDIGLQIERNFIAEIEGPDVGADRAREIAWQRRLTERLATLSGVEAASISSQVPFGLGLNTARLRAPGATPVDALVNAVGADYFSTIGLPLLRGRGFSPQETWDERAPKVALVDERLARQLWPDGSALGRSVEMTAPGAPEGRVEIVGITRATPFRLFDARPPGALYLPMARAPEPRSFLHVRWSSAGDAGSLLRNALLDAEPGLTILSLRSFRQHLKADPNQAALSAAAALFSMVGLLAVALAMAGVYGVMAYSVARRTREIGIRMAVGARAPAVLWMVLQEGLRTLGLGLALGLLLAIGGGRVVARLLYGVAPLDPWAFTLAPALLAIATLFACWLPARRAARVDPLIAIRTE